MVDVVNTKMAGAVRKAGPGAWRGTTLRERLATLLRDAYQHTPAAEAAEPRRAVWSAPTLRPLMTTYRRSTRQAD